MPDSIELLSPAGSYDALKAAVSAGADAVYLGAAAHGARASVGFDDETLPAGIRFAHLHGRRVYVTVNTLIKQRETASLRGLLQKLTDLHADAVIVQDLGALSIISNEFPSLQVHASTQMSVHNAYGAALLMESGVSRVVLARECSLSAIRNVADTGIEVEVFVHGAMCVSISGQCLFSSQIGGRSGNRGRCAQPCRLQYAYRDISGSLLSMRDLNTLEHLPRLLEAGATSFKIEGRLKRPEYVQVVTSAYRKALDRALEGKAPADTGADHAALTQIFSRGFTKGYAVGDEDARLIRIDGVSHQGIKIGTILSVRQREGFFLAEAALSVALHDGDGLTIRGSLDEQEIIYSGPETAPNQRSVLRLRNRAEQGSDVFRLQDETQLSRAREEAEKLPSIPFDAELVLRPGEPASLTLHSRGQTVEVQGEIPLPAENKPLDMETSRRFMMKTGGTPFRLEQLNFFSDIPAFLTAASMNSLRRRGIEMLEETLIRSHKTPNPGASGNPAILGSTRQPGPPSLYLLVPPDAERQAFLDAGAEHLIIAPSDFRQRRLAEQLKGVHETDILHLPRQISDRDLDTIMPIVRERGCEVMADNIGQVAYPREKPILTGEGIPVWNEPAIRLLQGLGVRAAVVSRELSLEEIAELPTDFLELILPVYGRTALMQLNHCPERVRLGLGKNRAGCSLCDRGKVLEGQSLSDRFGCGYPLVPAHFEDGCLISLYNHKALHLSHLATRMSWLIDARLEQKEDALSLTRHYASLMKGEAVDIPQNTEPGRFLTGVE